MADEQFAQLYGSLDSTVAQDGFLQSMIKAVEPVVSIALDAGRADAVKAELESYEQSLLNTALPASNGDENSDEPKLSRLLKPISAQFNMSVGQASSDYSAAESKAAAALQSAVLQWKLAVQKYEFALVNADTQAESTVAPAVEQRRSDQSRADATSRSLVLFYGMQLSVDTAVGTYATAQTGAATALAAAAGALLTAYAAYYAAVKLALAANLQALATAQSKRWQAIEAARDS